MKHEVVIMSSVQSPFVVHIIGACFETPNYCLVMDFMSGGNLFQLLSSSSPLEWNIRYQIALDVSRGIDTIHQLGIVHCDLKSLNILLDSQKRAKISDFGLSKVKTSTSGTTVIKPNVSGHTPKWSAPEILDGGHKTTKASDIYAFGIILWEISARKLPFDGLDIGQLYIHVCMKKGREKIHIDTPPEMSNLISCCWDGEPQKRPTMAEAVQILQKEQQNRGYKCL